MSGTILGKDQIEKVNAVYGRLYAHVRELLEGAKEPVQKMRIHASVESLNTTELATLFSELPFVSPAEKKALVRAAIFDVMVRNEVPIGAYLITDNAGVKITPPSNVTDIYSPKQFKLNPATTEIHQEPATLAMTAPAVLTKLADLKEEADLRNSAAQAEREVEVEKVRQEGKEAVDPIPGFRQE